MSQFGSSMGNAHVASRTCHFWNFCQQEGREEVDFLYKKEFVHLFWPFAWLQTMNFLGVAKMGVAKFGNSLNCQFWQLPKVAQPSISRHAGTCRAEVVIGLTIPVWHIALVHYYCAQPTFIKKGSIEITSWELDWVSLCCRVS